MAVMIPQAKMLFCWLLVLLMEIHFLPGHASTPRQLDPSWRTEDPPAFGHDMLHQEFLLNYTNFNHGSFGACPSKVLDYQSQLRLEQEQRPDPWMRKHYLELMNVTRHDIANYVNAPSIDQIVLLQSASTAVNSVLRSIDWQPGDIILYFDTAYGMVQNTAAWLHETQQIQIRIIPVAFPIVDGDDAYLKPLQQVLDDLAHTSQLDRLKLAVLDHISSAPAVVQPVAACAKIIKLANPNTFVLVDGAHAMGHIPNLNLQALEPVMDAYLSNAHKWLYSCKGAAFLWVNPKVVSPTFPEPTVISSANAVPHTELASRYLYVSTLDYTAPLTMSQSLAFRSYIGGEEAIYKYIRQLAIEAKQHLLDAWKVTALVPDEMEVFLINIPLPTDNAQAATLLMDYLLEEHDMYIRTMMTNDGIIYTRLSCQIYLELSDFVRLGTIVLDFFQSYDSRRGNDDTPNKAAVKD